MYWPVTPSDDALDVPRRRGRPPGARNKPRDAPHTPLANSGPSALQYGQYGQPALDDAALDATADTTIAMERMRTLVATGRIVLQALRDTSIDLLKRAELGLRAVQAFEGSKTAMTLRRGVDDMPRDAAEVERESEEIRVKLRKILDGGSTFATAVTAVQ